MTRKYYFKKARLSAFTLALTSIPACRKALRAGNFNRYMDFKHYKIYAQRNKLRALTYRSFNSFLGQTTSLSAIQTWYLNRQEGKPILQGTVLPWSTSLLLCDWLTASWLRMVTSIPGCRKTALQCRDSAIMLPPSSIVIQRADFTIPFELSYLINSDTDAGQGWLGHDSSMDMVLRRLRVYQVQKMARVIIQRKWSHRHSTQYRHWH